MPAHCCSRVEFPSDKYVASIWGSLAAWPPSPTICSSPAPGCRFPGVQAGAAMTTPRQPAPSREVAAWLREPSTCPRYCWHRARASPLYRDWRPGARRLGVISCPLPPLSNRYWQTTKLEANRPRLTQITAGAPGKQAEAGAQTRLASSVLANTAMFSTWGTLHQLGYQPGPHLISFSLQSVECRSPPNWTSRELLP